MDAGPSTPAAGGYIYKVPTWIKGTRSSDAYEPQVVSLGPFHHGRQDLLPMEEYKAQAMQRLAERCGKPVQAFIDATREVANDLEAAYVGLDDEWRGSERFVRMMATDGCFLLEMALRLRVHEATPEKLQAFFMWESIREDVVAIENQLPLLLLKQLEQERRSSGGADVTDDGDIDKFINELVLKFLATPVNTDVPEGLALHPLHILRHCFCARTTTPNTGDAAPTRVASCSSSELGELAMPMAPCPAPTGMGAGIQSDVTSRSMRNCCCLCLTKGAPQSQGLQNTMPSAPEPSQLAMAMISSPAPTDVASRSMRNCCGLCLTKGAPQSQGLQNTTSSAPELSQVGIQSDVASRPAGRNRCCLCLTKGAPQSQGLQRTMPCALEVSLAGISFKKSETCKLDDIKFNKNGCCPVLSMPMFRVRHDTERCLLNLKAFEQLHAGAGHVVTSYLCFMDNLINTGADVEVLRSAGVIVHTFGSDQAVADLFNTVSRGPLLSVDLHTVQREVTAHCKKCCNCAAWWAKFVRNYLSDPVVCASFLAATILLLLTIAQTFYAVYSYHHPKS